MNMTKAFTTGARPRGSGVRSHNIADLIDDEEPQEGKKSPKSPKEKRTRFDSSILPAPSGSENKKNREEDKCAGLLEENLELTERLGALEKELQHKNRDMEAQRLKIQELEEAQAQKQRTEAEEKQRQLEESTALQKQAQKQALEELRRKKSQQEEENVQLRTQLVEAEQRQAATKSEKEKLVAELKKQGEQSQLLAQELEDARTALSVAQSTLDTDRELLRLAQQENRELSNEVRHSHMNSESGKMVMGRHASLKAGIAVAAGTAAEQTSTGVTDMNKSSLAEPKNENEVAESEKKRQKARFVTMDLLSQLADVSEDEEEAEGSDAEKVASEPAPEKPPEGDEEGLRAQLAEAKELEERLRRRIVELEGLLEKNLRGKEEEDDLRRKVAELEVCLQECLKAKSPKPQPSMWDYLGGTFCASREPAGVVRPSRPVVGLQKHP